MTKIIMGYHFAKTGGTSIFAHLRNILGQEGFVSYGAHSNAEKFFKCDPQLEEMSVAWLGSITGLFGHGIREECAFLMPHHEMDLFFTYREPVSHFVSRLKHRRRNLESAGIRVEAKEFFDEMPANPVASELVARFPSFIEKTGDLYDNAAQVLEKFRFVFSTSELDEQIKVLNAYLGRDVGMVRKRVHTEQTELGEIDPVRILKKNDVDKRIYDEIVSAWHARIDRSDETSLNAFGFKEALLDTIRRAKAGSLNRETMRLESYSKFADDLHLIMRLEAAKLHLDRNRTLFVPGIAKAIDDKQAVYVSDAEKSISLVHKGEYLIGCGEIDQAETTFEHALALNSSNGLALWGMSKIIAKRKDFIGSFRILEKAALLAPCHVGIHISLGAIAKRVGKNTEALDAFKRALELAPTSEHLKKIIPAEWQADLVGYSR